jgi:Flp pilus assembly protein TadD
MGHNSLEITMGGDLAKYFGLSSSHLQAFAALGLQLFQQGRMHDATEVFEGLIALENHSYFGHAGLGTLALVQNPPNLESALTHLRRAAELQPEDPTVHANLGEALLRSARFDEAATAFSQALALDPESAHTGTKRARAILGAIHLIAAGVKSRKSA